MAKKIVIPLRGTQNEGIGSEGVLRMRERMAPIVISNLCVTLCSTNRVLLETSQELSFMARDWTQCD
jgi:hypothetical protein